MEDDEFVAKKEHNRDYLFFIAKKDVEQGEDVAPILITLDEEMDCIAITRVRPFADGIDKTRLWMELALVNYILDGTYAFLMSDTYVGRKYKTDEVMDYRPSEDPQATDAIMVMAWDKKGPCDWWIQGYHLDDWGVAHFDDMNVMFGEEAKPKADHIGGEANIVGTGLRDSAGWHLPPGMTAKECLDALIKMGHMIGFLHSRKDKRSQWNGKEAPGESVWILGVPDG